MLVQFEPLPIFMSEQIAISCSSLVELMKGENVVVIDVRGIDYTDGPHIKGSINIPSSDINLFKAKDIINVCVAQNVHNLVYCCLLGKARSVKAAFITQMAYSEMEEKPDLNIYYLEGGMESFVGQADQSLLSNDFT